MTSAFVLQTCFLSTCTNALLLHDSHPLNVNKALVVAGRRRRAAAAATTTTAAAPFRHRAPPSSWKPRHRRHQSVPATPSRRRRCRASSLVASEGFLRQASHSAAAAAAALPEAEMEHTISLNHSLEEAMFQSEELPSLPHLGHCGGATVEADVESSVVSASPTSSSETPETPWTRSTRSTRSPSSASRTNRLSLTLPIAPPTPYPSRPVPLSSSTASYPPTPIDTPALLSPTEPGEFITAIASQERRVLELREELSRAEMELRQLKNKFTMHEASRKRAERRNAQALRSSAPQQDTPAPDGAARPSSELDRRKALLLGLQSQANTAEHARRRMFSGGHTKTLSLLSPQKNSFAVLEDAPEDADLAPQTPGANVSDHLGRRGPVTPAYLSKRASWTPRSIHQQTTGMKQMAEDFRTNLWTFVEDLRQATVGEEPITGLGPHVRGLDGVMRPTGTSARFGEDQQDTIRASTASARPRADAAFEQTPTPTSNGRPINMEEPEQPDAGTPSRPPGQMTRAMSEAAQNRAKDLSWTADALDDEDWSSWDAPSVKSERWSGSTVAGHEMSGPGPEKTDENAAPLSRSKPGKTSAPSAVRSPLSPLSAKLEELLPPMLNQLAPSNIKRTASEFLTDWERNLLLAIPATDKAKNV